tara:strand:- start:678 stop:2018 length:1341 start_codon:yes stop_codon:yes gene_type:complete
MKNLISRAKKIFPYNRSLTGEGVKKTLKYIKVILPRIKIHSVRSKKKVFDWKIPLEWKIYSAKIVNISNKKKVLDFKDHNLHVVGYSTPVNKVLSLKNILPRIHTLPNQPNYIPYVTSYYKKYWGFCMKHKDKKKLTDGNYKVVINSKLFNGKMYYADLIIPGKSKKEIVFTTYICHPSMANNELSGPIVVSALAEHIIKNYKKNNFTYRFIFAPETIGAINYINQNIKQLKQNVIAGFVITCVGDGRDYSFVQSRSKSTLADLLIKNELKSKKKFSSYSYLDRGSDERQYCFPGVDLPFVTFCRSKFGTFPEYHTSADNFKIVKNKNLNSSLNLLINIVKKLETGKYDNLISSTKFTPKKKGKIKFKKNSYKVKTICEPNLGKRKLYPLLSSKSKYHSVKNMMNIIAYCDGQHNIKDLSKKIGISRSNVKNILKKLLQKKVIIRI